MKKSGVWGGRTTAERRAERRTRMIDAAVDIWSEEGWAAVSMRRVCAQTSLNDRYFYDEFTDRDGLLAAVWQTIEDDVLGVVGAAYARWSAQASWEELTRLVTTAFLERIVAEPARTKILLSRNEGGSAVGARRRPALERAVGLVVAAAKARMKTEVDEDALRMDAIFSVGGFIEILRAWQSGMLVVDAARIVEHTSALATRFSGKYLPSH